MTPRYQMLQLMRQRPGWLTYTLAVAALCGSAAQPVMARRWPMTEIANAAIQRDLVYKRVNSAVLTLDLYCPEKFSGPLPVIVWKHGRGCRRGGNKQRAVIGKVEM